jgi:hypothetical protein
MPSRQYQRWIRKAVTCVSCHHLSGNWKTYNLVLDWHDPEVDELNRRPNHIIGFERRNVDVLELALHGALSTTFGNRHKREESRQTSRRKQELIKRHALQRRQPCSRLGNREGRRQEAEPSVLERRHEETVRHEPHCALEIERWWEFFRVGNEVVLVEGIPPVEVVDLYREEVVLAYAAFLAHCALSDSRQRLGYCVCDTTQHLPLVLASLYTMIVRMFDSDVVIFDATITKGSGGRRYEGCLQRSSPLW